MRKIVIHRSDSDEDVAYRVERQSLGIASIGDTVEEAISMMREAIALHIEDLTAHGDPIPPEDSKDFPIAQTLVIEA